MDKIRMEEIAWLESIVKVRESDMGPLVIRVNQGGQIPLDRLSTARVVTLLTPEATDHYLSLRLSSSTKPNSPSSLIITLNDTNQPACHYLWQRFLSDFPTQSTSVCIVCPSACQSLSLIQRHLPTPQPSNLSFFPMDTSSLLSLKAAGLRQLLRPIEFASRQLDNVC